MTAVVNVSHDEMGKLSCYSLITCAQVHAGFSWGFVLLFYMEKKRVLPYHLIVVGMLVEDSGEKCLIHFIQISNRYSRSFFSKFTKDDK